MKNCILIFSLLFGLFANAQDWRSLNFNQNQHGLENNPLRGFATMWEVQSDFPYSIQGKLFKFNEIVTAEGVYDWSSIDDFIATEAARGKHVYLQVNIDPVKDALLDLPAYLLESLIETDDIEYITDIDEDGIAYNKYVSPDWNNEVLMDAMLAFIDTFGTKYNDDPRVFMVHVGLYGMWGEWHIFPFLDDHAHLAMTSANQALIANAYLESFPDVKLLGRYPQNMPSNTDFGYSDGLFFEESIGEPEWFFHNIIEDNGAGNNWKNHPIGGEMSPILQDTIFEQWPNLQGDDIYFSDSDRPSGLHDIQDVGKSLRWTHSSWIFANYLFEDEATSEITQAEINNAMRVQRMMGYTLFAKQYKLDVVDGILDLKLGLRNEGIAPIYANWDVELAVLSDGEVLTTLKVEKLDLDEILPSHYLVVKNMMAEPALEDGDYTVMIRIINPMSEYSDEAPPVRFANETQDMHKVGWLTIGAMSILDGELDEVWDETLAGPYGGVNRSIPGSIQGEDYDIGGNGVAYNDDALRQGNAWRFRPYDKVDIVRKDDASNGFAVGYSNDNEWLDYTVDVAIMGFYDITLKYYCAATAGNLEISIDGTELTTISGMETAADWHTSNTITVEDVFLEAGTDQVLRLKYTTGSNFDIDVVTFEPGKLIIDGTYTLKSKTGAYMFAETSGGALKSNITEMGDATKWTFTHLGDNVYTIASVEYTDERVEIPDGECGTGKLATLTAEAGTEDHKKWKASLTDDGYFMFEPLHCLDHALDIWEENPSTVHIWNKNPDNDNQLFELIAEPGMMAPGVDESASLETELAKAAIQVYPNPVAEQLNIYIPEADGSPSVINIFSLQGALLYSEITSKESLQIDTEVFKSAKMVIVQISNQNQTSTFKVVTQ